MKKLISAVLLTVILTSTACGAKTPSATNDFNYKVGTASYTHTNNSYGYTEGKNGRSAVSTTLVAAVFDNNGQIVRISIDEVESNIGFDNAGQLADFAPGEVKSKKELGDAYGMKAASSIGKEWYQQIESLEKWLEGKKVNTIIGGATAKLGRMISGNSDMSYTDQYGTYTPGTAGDMTKGTTNSAGSMAESNPAGGNNSTNIINDITSGANSMIDDMTDGDGTVGDNITAGSWMDEDLKASVTINTAYIEKAIEKAYQNAK